MIRQLVDEGTQECSEAPIFCLQLVVHFFERNCNIRRVIILVLLPVGGLRINVLGRVGRDFEKRIPRREHKKRTSAFCRSLQSFFFLYQRTNFSSFSVLLGDSDVCAPPELNLGSLIAARHDAINKSSFLPRSFSINFRTARYRFSFLIRAVVHHVEVQRASKKGCKTDGVKASSSTPFLCIRW